MARWPARPSTGLVTIIQGMAGIMYTTGTPETVPNKVGSPYVDYATGLMGASRWSPR